MKNLLRSTVFLAVVAALLWSTAFAGVKIGLQYQSPLQFGGLRFILAGIMVALAFGKWEQLLLAIRQEWRFIMLIAFVQTIVQYGMFYTGMNLVPGALGAMIVGSGPLFIAVIAHFTIADDRLTKWKTVSFLTGVAGIAIITLGRQTVSLRNPLEWVGILLLILNNLAAGYSNILVAKTKKAISPIIITSASLFFGGLALYLISIPIEGFQSGPFPGVYYISLFWLAFLSASAFSIWYTLLKRPGVKVSELNVWKFLIPVSGAALSWILVKGEHPDLYAITGMLVIALALVLMSFSAKKK